MISLEIRCSQVGCGTSVKVGYCSLWGVSMHLQHQPPEGWQWTPFGDYCPRHDPPEETLPDFGSKRVPARAPETNGQTQSTQSSLRQETSAPGVAVGSAVRDQQRLNGASPTTERVTPHGRRGDQAS